MESVGPFYYYLPAIAVAVIKIKEQPNFFGQAGDRPAAMLEGLDQGIGIQFGADQLNESQAGVDIVFTGKPGLPGEVAARLQGLLPITDVAGDQAREIDLIVAVGQSRVTGERLEIVLDRSWDSQKICCRTVCGLKASSAAASRTKSVTCV